MQRHEITNPSLQEAIVECESRISNLQANHAFLLEHAQLFEELARFPGVDLVSTDCSATGFSPTFYISMAVPGFTTEACPQLYSLLSWLDDYMEDAKCSCTDNPAESRRYYSFTASADSNLPDIFVTALLHDGAICTRVITGTKKVQRLAYVEVSEPTYAFKC